MIVVIFIVFLVNTNSIICEDAVIEAAKWAYTPSDVDRTTEVPLDEKWLGDAIKDVAYYLRAYKFNEWDRRYYQNKPDDDKMVGYYGAFPEPALRSLHWQVYEHCNSNFYKCVTYLHSVVETVPVTRQDDSTTILSENTLTMNRSFRHELDMECKKGLESAEATGLPFDGPLEKFQWRTSASYYMCWYTMLETPTLSILEDQCDNFANCLDPNLGVHNHDPRSDDRIPFACATYSFCPDPCCPLKYIKDITVCRHNATNPCYAGNREVPEYQVCRFERKNNTNFRDIILNKWNISCHCNVKGFIWKSKFGICVDVDECVTGDHTCDAKTEDCLNLPGSFCCICSWDHIFEPSQNKCKLNPIVTVSKYDITEHVFGLMNTFNRFCKFLGLR